MRWFMYPAMLLVALALPFTAPTVQAANTDPLFVNATSDEGHRAMMALTFAQNQLNRHHPVTIFLNDRGVFVGSKANAGKFKEQQELLAKLMSAGANVLICPFCMKHYGVAEADLLPGIRVGNPELTGEALFREGTRTLTW